ncbi:hypothetical protein TNCV_2553311 [Trichonephila clavipes]|nr:hypothetical protein TNCV_2553311 [Trichonephila clavipes]
MSFSIVEWLRITGLDSEGIQRLVWPARSPDLNPIENVWDALGRQVSGRNYPPTNKNSLIRALTEEWDKLPQQLLDNAVQSAPLRRTDIFNGSVNLVLCDTCSDCIHQHSRTLCLLLSSRGSGLPGKIDYASQSND